MSQLAKIVQPRQAGAVERPRLFKRLNALRRKGGALWIEGAPGAGKTTLLSSWLQSQRVRVLWFKVDEADKDHATFFHYLALAASEVAPSRTPLPSLTAEYGTSEETFARVFFRKLFLALPAGTLLVLDDVQEANGQFHGLLRALLEEAVPSIPVYLSSRAAPPPALSRFRASGQLALLADSELAFTRTETRALARRRGFVGSRVDLEALTRDAQGWPAGVVLRVLVAQRGRVASPTSAEHQFFAGEVFERLDPSTRQLLMETALLPPATEALLGASTGDPKAGTLVAGLAERGLFTLRLETSPPTFDFHALFRAFLRARAEEELPAARRAEVRRAAALVLAEEGRAGAEAAIGLLQEADAVLELAALVAREAPHALEEGRWQTVERWLGSIPAELRAENPWLLLWAGMAAMGRSPGEARGALGLALRMFEVAGNASGTWMAWAAGVQAVVAEWNDLSPLRSALADHDRLRDRFPVAPGELEVRVLLSAQAAAMLVQPDHPALPAWCQALRGLALASPVPALRLAAGAQLVLHETWLIGEVERHHDLVKELSKLALGGGTPAPLAALWFGCQAPAEFAAGDLDACARTAERALAYGASHGLRTLDFVARLQEFSVALLRSPETVNERLRAMDRSLRPGAAVDRAVFSCARGMAALRRGEAVEAVRCGEEALKLAIGSSYAVGQVMAWLLLARARARAGDRSGARTALHQARALGERTGSAWLRCVTAFIEAEQLLDDGRGEFLAAPLVEAFAAWRDKGVHPFLHFGLEEISRLCAAALERGTQVESVLPFIAAWRLTPPVAGPRPRAWPWPVRIQALGPLTVERDGRLVGAGGRVPRKPFDLLRVLIARGGRDVPEHLVAEMLWPDADGDAAQHALETTLYRLRRAVGGEVVLQRDRKLSLAPEHCWVDAFEVERLLGAALSRRQGRNQGPDSMEAEQIARLYRAPLLADVDEAHWAVEARDRLRSKVARWMEVLPPSQDNPGPVGDLRALIKDHDSGLRTTARLRLA